MYTKYGSIDDSCKIFDGMSERDLVSWNAMVEGCAQHRRGKEALQFFEEMLQAGMKPDHISFIKVLSTCSHAGLVNEGCEVFNLICQDHCSILRSAHYDCMIDLVGRAGCLDEAEDFINSMPYEPDASVRAALLGVYRMHGSIELGKRAAEQLFELELENPGKYVLLLNIYAAAGKFLFLVDTWTPTSARKKYYFLTHAHKDHTMRIIIHGCYPIYYTSVTKQLLINRYPNSRLDEFMFVDLEVGESVLIDDIEEPFTVTAFDANHCPGAIMLLFEGHFGNVLHTGDCRLSSDCLAKLPRKYISKVNRACGDGLDYIYLDCTFGREFFKMPSKYVAIKQVLSCIWRHPSSYPVYLACDVLGHEEILMEISKTFGSRIYVDKLNLAEYHALVCIVAPDLLTEDPSCRFHVCEGFPRLYERAKAKFAEAKRNIQLEPLFIRPSAQWYTCEERMDGARSGLITSAVFDRKTQQAPKEAERDQFGVWHVCFSMHSSQEELEEALAVLSPKEVISNTPNFRATELCYVRQKMCNAGSRFQLDPDWHFKTSRKTLFQVGLTAGISQVPAIQSTMANVTEKKGSPMKQKSQSLDLCATSEGQNIDRHLQLSSPTKPLPLFGRARHSLLPSPPMSFSDGEDACGSPKCRASLYDAAPPSPPLHSLQEMEVISCEKNLSQSANFSAGEKLWAEGRSSRGSRKDHERGMQLCVHTEEREEEFKNLSKLRGQSDQAENTGSPSSGKDGETQNSLVGCVSKENLPGFDGRNSRTLHESLRKMYRSLHVPIPQPLPSLLELANLIKKPKLHASQS